MSVDSDKGEPIMPPEDVVEMEYSATEELNSQRKRYPEAFELLEEYMEWREEAGLPEFWSNYMIDTCDFGPAPISCYPPTESDLDLIGKELES